MDIYNVNDDLVEFLTKKNEIVTVSKQFYCTNTNEKKVRFVENLLRTYDRIPIENNRKVKSSDVSTNFRKLGNSQFAIKGVGYFNALEHYNKSICFAENDSECLSLAYANRSAVYFELALYDACLQNIKLARLNGYPAKLEPKLIQREQRCIEQLNGNTVEKNEPIIPKLSYSANPKIPFIVSCLEMKETADMGRFIVTNKQLKPGDIIAIEDGFIDILLPQFCYQRCAYCLSENTLNLVPCKLCTSAMFCNENCYQRAMNEFHKIECPIIEYLFQWFNKIHLSAIRVAIKALNSFQSITKLRAFMDEVDETKINVFSMDYSKELTPEEKYQVVHTLETNENKRSPSDLFQRATIAAVACHKLFNETQLKEMLTTEMDQDTFIELLFRHLQTAPTNFHGLFLTEITNQDISFASGAYPFASLLNHSCAPNISRQSYGTKIVIYVIKVIEKGEQLFDNYGFHHCLVPKSERQSSLNMQYKFQCSCEACTKDYKLLFHLHQGPFPPLLMDNYVSELSEFNLTYAKDNLPKYCAYLTKYASFYPCAQLSEVQEVLKQCFCIIIGGNITLKAKCQSKNIN